MRSGGVYTLYFAIAIQEFLATSMPEVKWKQLFL